MSRDLILAGWSLLALLFLGSEMASALSGGRIVGLLGLMARLTRRNVVFVVFFLGWMWVGWHFFAR